MKTTVWNLNGEYFATAVNDEKYQVYSIGADNPKDSGQWVARATEEGVKYVASSSASLNAAKQKARRHGDYDGKVR